RPAVTQTQPAAKQLSSVGAKQDVPGPVPASSGGLQDPPGAAPAQQAQAAPASDEESLKRLDEPQAETAKVAVPEEFYVGFWVTSAVLALLLLWYYWRFDAEQFEILRMLTASVMPLAILTFVVLAVILFGITTA